MPLLAGRASGCAGSHTLAACQRQVQQRAGRGLCPKTTLFERDRRQGKARRREGAEKLV